MPKNQAVQKAEAAHRVALAKAKANPTNVRAAADVIKTKRKRDMAIIMATGN
jgi:hypothetical protein